MQNNNFVPPNDITHEEFLSRITQGMVESSEAGKAEVWRVTWIGASFLVLLAFYLIMFSNIANQVMVLVMFGAFFLYTCLVVFTSALERIARKVTSVLSVAAAFSGMYEEMTANSMRTFFRNINIIRTGEDGTDEISTN